MPAQRFQSRIQYLAEFLSLIDFRQKSESACWPWTGRIMHKRGYGQYDVFKKKGILAHRLSWELENGSIPAGLEVCHRCDNPTCVRPSHLFLGTHRENMLDAFKKGRLKVPSNGYKDRKTCKNGHEWTAENTIVFPDRRRCRACESNRESRRRKARS
jgi:hypothetical protein